MDHALHENKFLETLNISFTLKAVNINPRDWKILLQSRCRSMVSFTWTDTE